MAIHDSILLTESIANSEWVQENFQQLRKDIEGKFIAVKNKEIVASALNRKDLCDKLKEKKIDPSEVLIEFIPPKGQITLF